MASRQAQSLGLMAICFAISFFLWDWLYPVNVFVVVLHEWSHGLANVLTGGKILEIYIDPRAGGWCQGTSSWELTVTAAGYIGSSVLGAAILLAAALTRWDRMLCGGLGLFLVGVGLRYVGNPFGKIFCVGFGVFMVWAAYKLSERWSDFLLRFLGMSSCLYAVFRVRQHLLAHWYQWPTGSTGDATLDQIWAHSDADVLAHLTGVPATAWWVTFLIVGVSSFLAALWISVRYDAGWGSPEQPE